MGFLLETERLILVQTPLHVLKARLKQDLFHADIQLFPNQIRRSNASDAPDQNPLSQARTLHVYFPPEWPGEALVWFPHMISHYEAAAAQGKSPVNWGGILIERAEQVAIGQMGFKGLPDAQGCIEIGYGLNRSYWGRGYATEMVQAMTEWALARPEVRRVTAECTPDNLGSIRVLEKSGFVRTGMGYDDEDGDLILWERTG